MKGSGLRFLGHASMLIESTTNSVLVDPWFSDTGAFLGTWHPFPANDHIDLAELRSVDFVVLSHEHEDHFDLEFLRSLSETTTIVIPRYTDGWLHNQIRQLPNRCLVLDDRVPTSLGPDISVCAVVQSAPIWDDCALVFQTPFGTVLDCNDMKVSGEDIEWIHQHFPRPEWLVLQFSGANWHPEVYDYTPEDKARISIEKVANKFYSVANLVGALDPVHVLPCAGPAAFLDDDHFELNFRQSIFPRQDRFVQFAEERGFRAQVVVALPGDQLVGVDVAALTDDNLRHDAFTRTRSYLEAYRARRIHAIRSLTKQVPDHPDSLLQAADAFFRPLVQSSPWFRARLAGCVRFRLTGAGAENLILDFSEPANPIRPDAGEECFYEFEFDKRWMAQLMDRQITWEQLFLSLRWIAHRNPDSYNEDLVVFLRFANPDSYLEYETWQQHRSIGRFFEVAHGDTILEIQSACPHAGGDLSRGVITDGFIVCPLHGWKFSLKDGSCVQSRKHRIAVRQKEAAC